MTDIYENDLLYWLWLTIAFGPANPRKWTASARFSSVKECYEAFERGSFDGLSSEERRSVKGATLEQAEKLARYCDDRSINIYSFGGKGYPEQLKNIYNPPSVLFSYGSLEFLDDCVTLGIVGARKATDYTKEVTDRMSRELSRSGIVIISGFANGVDAIAHIGAIESGGKTVAVLGCGLEHEYPKDSNRLKKQISENGAAVSEYFPQTRPDSNSFKARNRILSGLSKGVLITQASKISGALNTASHALQQGRDLFCIPPADIFSPDYAGVSGLIRDGAVPVFSCRDILYEYYTEYSHKLRFTKDSDAFSDKSQGNMFFAADIPVEKTRQSGKKKSAKNRSAEANEAQVHQEERKPIDTSALTDEQKRIIAELESSPEAAKAADEIADKLEMDVSDLFTELTALEIEGYVRSLAGNRYELI